MERGNKALFVVLLVTLVVIGGRMMFVGAGGDDSNEDQVRANLFSTDPHRTQPINYPTRREIEEARAN